MIRDNFQYPNEWRRRCVWADALDLRLKHQRERRLADAMDYPERDRLRSKFKLFGRRRQADKPRD
jgi:hypothetical protein